MNDLAGFSRFKFIVALRFIPRRNQDSPRSLLHRQRRRICLSLPSFQHAMISFHDFSVFLREQTHLNEYFRVSLRLEFEKDHLQRDQSQRHLQRQHDYRQLQHLHEHPEIQRSLQGDSLRFHRFRRLQNPIRPVFSLHRVDF